MIISKGIYVIVLFCLCNIYLYSPFSERLATPFSDTNVKKMIVTTIVKVRCLRARLVSLDAGLWIQLYSILFLARIFFLRIFLDLEPRDSLLVASFFIGMSCRLIFLQIWVDTMSTKIMMMMSRNILKKMKILII